MDFFVKIETDFIIWKLRVTHPGSKSLLASPAPKVARLGVERQKPLQANFGQYFIFLFTKTKQQQITKENK